MGRDRVKWVGRTDDKLTSRWTRTGSKHPISNENPKDQGLGKDEKLRPAVAEDDDDHRRRDLQVERNGDR